VRILVYELNEIPWSVVDRQVARRPRGAFARLVREGACHTTQAVDTPPLHPWVTWPTLHRGVPAGVHGLRMPGQPLPSPDPHPPLWELARRARRRVGLFGPFHSWPPPPVDFALPDLFAPDDQAVPASLVPFQHLVRSQADACGRVVEARPPVAPRALLGLVRAGVGPRSFARGAGQLLGERREAARAVRRPAVGTDVAMDVFLHHWRRARPDYAAFFTNHLAWLMHRYWAAAWPAEGGRAPEDRPWAAALEDGLDRADDQLGRLLALTRRDPELRVVVASSMGQDRLPPGPNLGALRLADPDRLVELVGAEPARRGRAMEPDHVLLFADSRAAAAFVARVGAIVDPDGAAAFSAEQAGTAVRLHAEQQHAALVHRRLRWAGELRPLEAYGLVHLATETAGAAHHVPEGVLAWWGAGARADAGRRPVEATRYAPTLLHMLGVAPAAHHEAPLA